jgi:hypothetical protein
MTIEHHRGKGVEQRTIPRLRCAHQLFRVPLHTEHPPVVRHPLHALDDTVGRMRNYSEALAHPVHRLMMHRVHLQHLRAQRGG